MPRSNTRRRMYKSLGAETLPCVWCGERLSLKQRECTVEHIICDCIKELRSDGFDNCKIACETCNNLRGILTQPEIYTYRFWRILCGKEKETPSDGPLLDKYLDECRSNKIPINTKTLYDFMRKHRTRINDQKTIDFFTKKQYHRYYMERIGELLNIEVRYS